MGRTNSALQPESNKNRIRKKSKTKIFSGAEMPRPILTYLLDS